MKASSQIKAMGQQAGYTLVELAISIAIISVLVVSALFGVQRIVDNNNVNATSQQVTLTSNNVKKFAAMLADKAFVNDTNTAANLGIWPDNITTKVNGLVTKITNPFGGNYYMAGNSADIGAVVAGNGYYIVITNVPDRLCSAVAGMFGASAWEIRITDEPTPFVMTTGAQNFAGNIVKRAGDDRIWFSGGSQSLSVACGTPAPKKTVFLFFPL
jgi:prepilin-type N-terminal cleavage/methylation domain-containing protein